MLATMWQVQASETTALLAGDYITLSDMRISFTPQPQRGDYIDVQVMLIENPGVFGFLFNIVFDESALTPVSITGGRGLRGLNLTLPPTEGGARSNRLVFSAHSEEPSFEVGLIATVRFNVADGLGGEFPMAFGEFFVMACDGEGGMDTASVSTGANFAPAARAEAFGAFSFEEDVDITGDFECENFLIWVREMVGVFDRPLMASDAMNFPTCCIVFYGDKGFTSLAGIEHFRDIRSLGITGNSLEDVNLSFPNMRYLSWIHLSDNRLTSLDVSGIRLLNFLSVGGNYFYSEACIIGQTYSFNPGNPNAWFMFDQPPQNTPAIIDITSDFNCPNFLSAVCEFVDITGRPLTNIDLWQLGSQLSLDFSNRGITSLAGLEHFNVIEALDVSHNQLTEINLPRRNTRQLTYLNVSHNQLTRLDVSNTRHWRYFAVNASYNYMASSSSVIRYGGTCCCFGISLTFYPQNTRPVIMPSLLISPRPRNASTPSNTIIINYSASPGMGADIMEISYRINGGAATTVYTRGHNNVAISTSSLVQGVNEVVFTVTDSTGNIALYTVRLIAPHGAMLQLHRN